MSNNKIKFCKGFTLIELLTVLAVLGAMMGFVLIRFIGPESKARDNRRYSDIRQYQNALEIYASQNNSNFPGGGPQNPSGLCGAGNPLGDILCPDDPTGPDYQYWSDALGLEYVLWALLENPEPAPEYFIVCSNGAAGQDINPPISSTCPL